MRVLDVVQGTVDWRRARAGIPTASRFDRLVTPRTRKPSAQAEGYALELAAEWLLGEPLDDDIGGLPWVQRGRALEDAAVSWYEFARDTETQRVGLCVTDDGSAGCSPDRVVPDDGGLEIKAPGPATHVGYLVDEGALVAKYACQVQGGLWVTGRAWWDLMSYHPDMPPVLVRVERDEEMIGKIDDAVGALHMRLADLREALTARGCVPVRVLMERGRETA